jgi:hypothetical protein
VTGVWWEWYEPRPLAEACLGTRERMTGSSADDAASLCSYNRETRRSPVCAGLLERVAASAVGIEELA